MGQRAGGLRYKRDWYQWMGDCRTRRIIGQENVFGMSDRRVESTRGCIMILFCWRHGLLPLHLLLISPYASLYTRVHRLDIPDMSFPK